jgi:hypothetical protein
MDAHAQQITCAGNPSAQEFFHRVFGSYLSQVENLELNLEITAKYQFVSSRGIQSGEPRSIPLLSTTKVPKRLGSVAANRPKGVGQLFGT